MTVVDSYLQVQVLLQLSDPSDRMDLRSNYLFSSFYAERILTAKSSYGCLDILRKIFYSWLVAGLTIFGETSFGPSYDLSGLFPFFMSILHVKKISYCEMKLI